MTVVWRVVFITESRFGFNRRPLNVPRGLGYHGEWVVKNGNGGRISSCCPDVLYQNCCVRSFFGVFIVVLMFFRYDCVFTPIC